MEESHPLDAMPVDHQLLGDRTIEAKDGRVTGILAEVAHRRVCAGDLEMSWNAAVQARGTSPEALGSTVATKDGGKAVRGGPLRFFFFLAPWRARELAGPFTGGSCGWFRGGR